MASHHRHTRHARRRWCAGLAAVAAVAASLASAGTASAAAPAAAASSADCSGTAAAEPLVPFNTIAYDGTTAEVQVGAMFCPDPDGQAVQVVVLDSKTLHLVSNRGYSTSQFEQLGSDLKALSKSAPGSLVFVTHPGNQPALSGGLDQLDSALGAIGGTVGAKWLFGQGSTATACSSLYTSYCEYGGATWSRGTLNGSSFTVIGIPGMPAGQAWRETAAQNGTADGRITGYLELGTVLSPSGSTAGGVTRYTVVNGPDPYMPVDTCVDPADPDNLNDPWCAVKVGDQTYPAESGVNGLHVVELDRTTLGLIPGDNRTVTTAAQLNGMLTSTAWLPVPAVGQSINATNFLNDQRLVIIQSVGDGTLSGILSNATLQAIDQLGGTVDYLADAVTKGCRYALVGAATDLPWHATTSDESSTAMVKPGDPCSDPDQAEPDQPTGHVSGVVQRDRDGLYTPSAASAVGPTNVALYQDLYQPAKAWPYATDTEDLRYIADNIGLCAQAPPAKCNPNGPDNSDVRSAYPDTEYARSWSDFRENLDHLTCPPTPPKQSGTCDPDNFGNVKDELYDDEFPWINRVYALTDDLRAPYLQSGGAYYDVKTVTNQVLDNIPAAADHTATMQWLKIFTDVMTVASKAAGPLSPAASAVFGVLGAASTLAADLMQTSSGGTADSVTAPVTKEADGLADQLAKQQTAYLEWVNNAQDILLSDYARLRAVGTNPLSWPGSYTNYLIEALQGSSRASAYSALVPVVWGGYNLQATTATSTGPLPNPGDPNDVTKYGCSEYYLKQMNGYPYVGVNTTYPFKSALELNQFHSVAGFNVHTGAVLNEVWTFARDLTGFANDQYPAATVLPAATPPETDIASDIYGDNSTSAQAGAYQYEASWWRSTFNPPSHTSCTQLTEPNSGLTTPYSRAFPPPTIPPPLPS